MAGWQPVPGGKHGGMRRKVGGKWQYKYPSQMDAQNAMRHHRSHANKHLNVPGHDSGSGHEVKHADPDKRYEAQREAYRHHKDAMEGAAAFAESGRASSSEDRRKQRIRSQLRRSEVDSLDLVRGSPMGTSIAEFGETVGEIQYTEPAPLAPGYQGGLYKAKYTRREPKPGGGYRYFYDKPAGQKQSAAKDEPETAQGRVQAMFDKLDTSIKQVKHFTMNGRPVAVAMGQFGADAQREDFRNKHYIRVTVNGKDMATVGTPAEIAAWVARSPTMLDMLDPKGSVASTPRPKPSWER